MLNADAHQLSLIQVNDTHAYFELHPELFWTGKGAVYRPTGGYARVAALLKQIRAEHPGRVLAFDGGDTFHGTFVAVESQGQALVPILNATGLDGMTGHWDFAYGPAHLQTLTKQLHYPMLAANCFDKESHQPYFAPYTICEVDGLRVGAIGLAAYIIDKTMPPHFGKGIYLTLGKEVLPGYIDQLRAEERVDLVVVVSHLGFPQDAQLAQDVRGIDVLLSAHTHHRLSSPVQVNGTLIIQSGCHGSFLGRLDLAVEEGHVRDYRHSLITVTEQMPQDEEVHDLVEQALAPHREYLAEVVGHTDVGLHRNTMFETTMDNFLLSALTSATGAELAFSNGWRYGAPVPPGPVTVNDLYNITPMNPPLSTVDLSGEEVRTMLEENLESTFASSPYEQMGGYVKRCRGLTAYIKVENPVGQRIQAIFVNEQPLDPKRAYSTVFVTTQGVPAKYGHNRQETDLCAVDVMQNALARGRAQGELINSFIVV